MVIFGPGIFFLGGGVGGCWKPLGFFGVLMFAPIRSSLSLEIPSNISCLNHFVLFVTAARRKKNV